MIRRLFYSDAELLYLLQSFETKRSPLYMTARFAMLASMLALLALTFHVYPDATVLGLALYVTNIALYCTVLQ